MNYTQAKKQLFKALAPPRLHDHYCATVWSHDNVIEVVRVGEAKVYCESLGSGTKHSWPLLWWREMVAKKIIIRVTPAEGPNWPQVHAE